MNARLLTCQEVAERLGLAHKSVLNALSARRRGLPAPAWAALDWRMLGRSPRLSEDALARYQDGLPPLVGGAQ